MEIKPLAWTRGDVRATDTPHVAASRVRRQYWAQGACMPACLDGLDWRAQVVYRKIATPGHWGQVAAALACNLLGIDAMAAARGSAPLETSAAEICGALAQGMTGMTATMAEWVRQFDDAWPICFDGRRFGVWCNGAPVWSPETQCFGGLCHALCAAACKCDVASIEDVEIAPMLNALPTLIAQNPSTAATALEAVLNHREPVAQGWPSPVRALALGGALLAGGACLATVWPAAFLLAGAAEAAAVGVMLRSLPRGPDSTERIRLAAWFSIVLPELTVDQIHRLCDRLEGCDARLDVVLLVAELKIAFKDGSGRSPDEVIARWLVREMEREAIERDLDTQSLERFARGDALEAVVHLLSNADMLVYSPQEVSTRPYALRLRDWYEYLEKLDGEMPRVLRLSDRAAPRTSGVDREWRKFYSEQVASPTQEVAPSKGLHATNVTPGRSSHQPALAWIPNARVPVAKTIPPIPGGSWGGVSAAPLELHPMLPQAADVPDAVSEALTDAGHTVGATTTGAALRRWREGSGNTGTLLMAVGGTVVTASLLYLAYLWGGRATNSVDAEGHAVDPYAPDNDLSAPQIPLALPLAQRRTDDDEARSGESADASPVEPNEPATALGEVDIRASLTPQQILTLSEWVGWHGTVGSAAEFRHYRELAVVHARELVQYAYTAFSKAGNDLDAVDWDARVEVQYQEHGFFPVVGNTGVGLQSRREFSLLQIAFGHHYYEESLSIGGLRSVGAVRAASANGAETFELTRKHLKTVNSDAFRASLHKLDLERINALSTSAEAIAGFSQYVKSIAVSMLVKVRDADRSSNSFWKSPTGQLPPREILERQLELQLMSYRGEVVPGLLALRHAASRTALILSIKQQKWFWWSKEVEVRDDWREFMRDHLSVREMVSQDEEIFSTKWSHVSIGPVCNPDDPCPWKLRGSRKQVGAFDRFRLLAPGRWAFTESSDIEAALWRAEVRRMRLNLDLQVVTPELRSRRDWDDFRVALLQGSMVFFPIAGGVFRGAAAAVDWSFRLGYAGATAGYLSVLSDRAEYATLSELESIYSNMRFGMLMLLVNQIPATEPLAKCVRLTAGLVSNAGRQILRQVARLMNIDKPIIARKRELLAELAKGLRTAPMSRAQSEAPWGPLKALKTRVGALDDVVIRPTPPGQQTPVNVLHFMGMSATFVASEDLLTRMPPGYLVAFVAQSGNIIYAGVTCGSGKILGSCTEYDVEPLPHNRFDTLDLLGEHRGALSFWADGVVACDGELFTIWVESPVDALAEIKVSKGILARARAEMSGYLSAPVRSSSGEGSGDLVRTPRSGLDGASDPSLPKWNTMVSQWQACRYGVSTGSSASNDGSDETRAMTSTTPAPSERLAGATGTSISTMALNHHWTPAFEIALNDVFERIEAGLLLWHFGRMPSAQQAMILARLRRTTGLRTIALAGVDIPGVVAMQSEQAHLLMSLTTGEVSWEGGTQVATNASLRRFLQRHVSDADAARLVNVLTQDTQPTQGQRHYEIVFQTPVNDFFALVNRSNQWLENQISCFGNIDQPCAPVRRDHDLSYLIAAAAERCPGGDGQAIVNLVRALAVPGERDNVPAEHLSRRGGDSDWRDTPGLPFADYLGESISGAAADVFASDCPPGSAGSIAQRVSDHVARSLERYAMHRMRSELADLVGFGAGDETFAIAMSAAGEALQDGRFGPAMATVSRDVLPAYSGWAHMPQAYEPRSIAGASDMRRIPPGYRIFLTSERALDEGTTGIHHEMLSLGNGTVAAWCRPGVGAQRSLAYQRLDLLSENGYLKVASSAVTLADGTPVMLWAEPGTPGAFGETLNDVPSGGHVTDVGILPAMRANPVIAAELQRNVQDADCRFGGDPTVLMATMARTLADGGVVDIRYRLVASWSGPNQAFPAVSLTLTGQAPQSMLEDGESGRLVVDLFMSRPLGADMSSVDIIQSEGGWLSTYRQHARGRCIQFREFSDVSAIVTALREYEAVPGILAHDWREGAQLVTAPEWGRQRAPGWHPNRRASVCRQAPQASDASHAT